jgi:putative ABC transport system permease protein
VLNEFEAFGTNKIFIEPRWPRNGRMVSWRQIMFRVADFENLIENCPSVAKFTPMHWDRGTVAYGTKVEDQNVAVMGVDPDWHDIEHRYVTLGRTLTVLDNEMVRPVCLINKVVRDKLEMDRDPVGEYIEVEGNRMLVVGLLEEPAATLGSSAEQREVVIPFRYAISKDRWPWFSVMAASKSPQLSEDAKAEIEFYMRQKRGIKPGAEDTFQVMTAQRVVDQFNKVATMVTLIATGIVGVSLLVGGVGIMNIMLVSVSERTREIGLRKALGAHPSAILLQFLVEAVVLCLLGGAMGLILGQAITTTVASFIPESAVRMGGESVTDGKGMRDMVVPPLAIAVAFGFSAATGLIFGMFPAIKAARLDPIEALRHE